MTLTPRFNLPLLLDMLTYARPAKSQTTVDFCKRFIKPLPGAWEDGFQNWHVIVGTDSPVLWSCHTDTVHKNEGRQTLHYDRVTDMVQLSKRSKRYARCLGADDTAGVFLCVSMIEAGIPGHYVFHHAEEIGGIGSSDIAEHTPDVVSSSTFAIALDRKGTRDVITHQFGRCCSDTFAQSLADQLNRVTGLDYRPDSSGVFTDTANYTGQIRECTNLSVGYYAAHSERETLDVTHLRQLLDALCQLDQSALVAERDVPDLDEYEWAYTSGRSWGDTYNTRSKVTSIGTAHSRFGTLETSDAECFACGYWYVQSMSTAEESDVYCCQECEHYDLHVRALEQSDMPQTESCYLDETYEAVQEALNALPSHRRHKIH